MRALLIATGLTVGAGLGAPAPAAAADEALLQATPLILKDGRIANVSVHVVAFPQGQSVLASADARQLRGLSEDVATDCFLTAQVIGHVGSAEVAGSDTLDAHRLARSRADAVQASLIEGGLPAKSIASVWDWQFMVREPRATLWVFRLTPGEDCEDAPLNGAAPALVAQIEPQDPIAADGMAPPEPVPAIRAAAVEPPKAARPAAEAASPAVVTARPAGPSPTPPTVPIVTQALPAASPSTSATVAAADVMPPVGSIAALPGRPKPAAETAPAETKTAEAKPAEVRSTETKPAETKPAEVVARVEPPARQPVSSASAAPNARQERLAIVFPSNSSYFPPGAGQQLRSLLQALGADGAFQVVLQSSVSGSQKVVGAESADEAARYNKWLAERRLERVREWFDRNAAGRELTFREDYREGDESRQVVIEARPTG